MPEQTCDCGSGEIPVAEVSKTVDQHLSSLDPQRADAFAGLHAVRTARAAGYAREKERLAVKYGGDHPRVAAVEGKIRFNDGLRRDVAFETARAGTATPVVDKGSYAFHGFVRDRKGDAVPRLTIALYDEDGNWIRELGYGCTDERGYFLIEFKRGRSGSEEKLIFTRRAAADAKVSARIYVLDAKKATLQIEKQPLHPQLGEVDFRIIILGAETVCCTPPPPEAGEPPEPPAPTSTPLENIRGIGPSKARKLRAAGIKDIETLLKTDTAKLVEIAGFDANIKRDATAALKKAKEK